MFRYPGGKSKLKKIIISIILDYYREFNDCYYCEPFFGAGSIGLDLIDKYKIKKVILNDFDYEIYCFWSSVLNSPDKLCFLIENFIPSVEKFNEFKDFFSKIDNYLLDKEEIGFRKIAIHQMSFSGLGVMAGGPIGGISQSSNYKIDCRWNSKSIIKKIKYYHNIFRECNFVGNDFFCTDFEIIINKLNSINHFLYLDPPYYNKGKELYKCSFNDEDHIRLVNLLKNKDNWLLSYDDCDFIRELYSWANIKEQKISYTINIKDNDSRKTELLIFPDKIKKIIDKNINNDIILF